MYLHAGRDTVIRVEDIVGIFDTDASTQNETTVDYLRNAERSGKLINVTDDVPKSFIVTKDNKVYMCQLSATALKGRLNGADTEI